MLTAFGRPVLWAKCLRVQCWQSSCRDGLLLWFMYKWWGGKAISYDEMCYLKLNGGTWAGHDVFSEFNAKETHNKKTLCTTVKNWSELCTWSEWNQPNLFGEAVGGAAGDGLVADVAFEYRVDRIEEAGLSSSNRSDQQDPNLRHRVGRGAVEPDALHHLDSLPDQTRSALRHLQHLSTLWHYTVTR